MALWPKSIQSPGLGGICMVISSLTNGRSLISCRNPYRRTVLSIYDENTHVLSPIVNPYFCFA